MRGALAFLTVIPVRARCESPGRSALIAFPFVGLFIGVLWTAVAWSSSLLWGPSVAAAVVLLSDLLVTGGLHIDAVGDVADGLASRRPSEEAVAIMRDAAIGAVGGAALIVVVLLRFAFLTILVSHDQWLSLILVPVTGRAAMVWVLGRTRTSRSPSLASSFTEVARGGEIVVATVIGALTGLVAGGIKGIAAVFLAVIAVEVWMRVFEVRFGAMTGDAVGASGIVAEVFVLAVMTASIV